MPTRGCLFIVWLCWNDCCTDTCHLTYNSLNGKWLEICMCSHYIYWLHLQPLYIYIYSRDTQPPVREPVPGSRSFSTRLLKPSRNWLWRCSCHLCTALCCAIYCLETATFLLCRTRQNILIWHSNIQKDVFYLRKNVNMSPGLLEKLLMSGIQTV